MRMKHGLLAVGSALAVAACTGLSLPFLPGLGGDAPGKVSGTTSRGTVVVNGTATSYHVDPDTSHLLIAVFKNNGANCGWSHDHAIAALAVNYTFDLDPNAPGSSQLTAEVIANGLDPDQPSYRASFPQVSDSQTFTSRELQDIRVNMLGQVDASSHPTLTFHAHDIASLSGDTSAIVDVDIRGSQSSITLTGTASTNGDRFIFHGTGPLSGSPHGIPNGTFAGCVQSGMELLMHLELVPGADTSEGVDGSVAVFEPTEFPDENPCGAIGYQTRDPQTRRTVQQAIAVGCGTCHSQPQQYSATVPLASWHDFHVDSALSQGVPLWQDSLARLTDPSSRHMPVSPYELGGAELTQISAWLQSGAHRYQCDGNGAPLPEIAEPPPQSTCEANARWLLGDVGSDRMHPGGDCIACHAREREGPTYRFAGTVMLGLHDQEDCNGLTSSAEASPLRVVITGANGDEVSLPVNRVGNFFSTRNISLPYTARILNTATGQTRFMLGPQTVGACNHCHTPNGAADGSNLLNPPAGRILPPGP